MVWTCKLIKKVYHLGKDKIEVYIEFSDGTDWILNSYYVKDLDEIKRLARNRIKELEVLKPNFDSLIEGDLDVTLEKNVIPPKELTQEEINKQNYSEDIEKYHQIKRAIEIGILQSTEIDNIKTKLKNNFIQSYLDLI